MKGWVMDFSWVQSLLTLLFGQVGAMGTLLVAACSYLGWSLYREQEYHRKQIEAWNEKRLELHEQNLKALSEMRTSIDILTRSLGRRRSNG